MLEEMLSSCVESFLGQLGYVYFGSNLPKRKRDLDLTNISHDQNNSKNKQYEEWPDNKKGILF